MSRKMGSVIATYGVFVSLLACFLRFIAADKTSAFYVGLSLGLLSLAFGIAAIKGWSSGRKWVIITSAFATFLLLTEVVSDWGDPTAESSPRAIMMLLLFLAFGMLFYSLHAERPADYYDGVKKS